jgi:hypothetical protein
MRSARIASSGHIEDAQDLTYGLAVDYAFTLAFPLAQVLDIADQVVVERVMTHGQGTEAG